MSAKIAYKKGEIVRCDPCQPVASIYNKVPTCSNCAVYLGSGVDPTSSLTDSLSFNVIPCDKEKCSYTVYCSHRCRDSHGVQHELLCRKNKYTNQFYKYAYKRTNERMIHALSLINALILTVKASSDDHDHFLSNFTDVLLTFLKEYAVSSRDGAVPPDELEESYLYLKSLLSYDTKSSMATTLIPTVLTIEVYSNILSIAQQHVVPVVSNTPFLTEARNIIKIKGLNERISTFRSLMAVCGKDVIMKIGYECNREYSPLEYDRIITHFVNFISTISANLPVPSLFQGLFYVLLPRSLLLPYSCAHNAVIELVQSSPQGSPLLQCIAMYDINEGDRLYISNRPAEVNCACSWCWYKKLGFAKFISNESQLKHNYSCDHPTLMAIAHTCMQQGRDANGVQLYQYLLSFYNQQTDTKELGVLHYTLGVALLNMPTSTQKELLCGSLLTRWSEAYDHFKAGFAVDSTNEELLEINEKLLSLPGRVYSSHEIQEYTSKNSDNYKAVSARQIHIFKEPYTADGEDCAMIIQDAEAYAGENGWTTTRHSFVPTTDLPVYKIPRVLTWFNTFMDTKVIPLLIKQYIPESSLSCRIGIHDAFIVKYEATRQRSLPLHTDQSTHSLIIALNEQAEYTGGGTYFKQLDTSYRLQKGEVLSFPGGSLEHAGDPLLHGTRYIIAVFLFLDFTDNNKRKFHHFERGERIDVDKEATHFQFNFTDT